MKTNEQNSTKNLNRVGKLIKKYREENDLTQLDVAKTLNYKYANFIGMLESGASVFPLKRCLEFADVLGVDRAEFIVAALCDLYPQWEPYLKPLLKNK